MERKICKGVRRSPRLVAKTNFMNTSNYSTSMQDLNLVGATTNNTTITATTTTKSIISYTSDLGPYTGNVPASKHEPKIIQRNPGKENNNLLQQPSRALKRMRDSTLSLNTVMPTPVKRVKSSSDTTLPEHETTITNDTTKAEPIKKKLTKVISFARGLSPRRSRRKKCSEKAMQRSTSLRESLVPPDSILNPKLQFPPPPPPVVNPVRTRGSQRWIESFADIIEVDSWTSQQIKRQESIHELYTGEADLIEDINLLQGVYFNPLSESKLVKGEDLSSIFETAHSLLPLHEDLVKRLEGVRAEDGSIDKVGEILLTWIPTLRPYIVYCAKQLEVKEILLHVSKDKQVSDFFQKCLEQPCSRKLDLWSFLDSPRTKLVKYPLLISNIYKYTPKDHPDRTALEKSIKELERLIKDADTATGIAKCNFYKNKLNFMEDEVFRVAFDRARMLICNGCLRNKSGSKCDAFLFDTMFILARTTTRNGNKVYVMNTKPVLVADMRVFDLGDGEIRLGGSFRTTLSKGPTARHAFRVNNKWSECDGKSSIILQANDQHDKKQWLNAFQSVLGESATKSIVIQ